MEAHGYRHTGELVEAINSGAYAATEEDIEALPGRLDARGVAVGPITMPPRHGPSRSGLLR